MSSFERIQNETELNETTISYIPLEVAEFEKNVAIFIPVVFGMVTLVGSVGNILVIIVSFKYRQMKTLNCTMVVALAVADLCFLTFCVPFTAVIYATNQYLFGNIWCKISQYFAHLSACWSVSFLCLMSTDRFLAIVFPLKSLTLRTRKNLLAGIGIIVCFCLAMNIPVLFLFRKVEYVYYNENRSTCIGEEIRLKKLFFACFGLFFYCFPVIYLTMLHTLMYVTIKRREIRARSNKKALKIILAVEVGFFVCWTPIQLLLFLSTFNILQTTTDWQATSIVVFVSNIFSYSHSCLNPLLYTFVSQEYRSKLKTIFGMN